MIRPCHRGLYKMHRKRKDIVKIVCREQLRLNYIEHNKAQREATGKTHDVEHIDKDNNKYYCISSPVCGDGTGSTRAYNHRVTGDGHTTVIVSALTNKPLMFWHNQTSCMHCQNVMSKLLECGKHADETSLDELKHPNKPFYRNTKQTPATAEDPAMRNLGKCCIIDPDSGELQPDDEVILGSVVITNGDSKGALGNIAEQDSIITTFAGKAACCPAIGHFLKYI